MNTSMEALASLSNFSLADVSFCPILELDFDGQMRIRELRNHPDIRANMYTSHEITEREHLRWIDRLATDRSTQFYAVMHEGRVVGAVSLNAISETDKRADWAYYLDPTQQGKGFGRTIEFKMLNYAFRERGLMKLNCQVLFFNEKVIAMHKKFGFKEEGILREHIRRDDEAIDVVLLGITRDEWLAASDAMLKRSDHQRGGE